ncbi:hypothetical protein Fmac_006004 [Flemingia macrophylla]|uniref:Fungal lipase-type domain-containing protein n=1 Tax=Flemingia macrophylla TaxID=520843 RepID=A0ABD1N9F0_9FABA
MVSSEGPHLFSLSRPLTPYPLTTATESHRDSHRDSHRESHPKSHCHSDGPLTSRSSLLQIREAVRAERTAQLVLLNYSKDGSPFWILLRVSPVFSPRSAAVVHFLVVQVPLFRHRASSPVRYLAFRRSCSKEVLTDSFSDFNCRSFCSCYNQLTGSIPTQLGALRNLRVVALQSNNLTWLNPERISGVFKQEVQVHSGFLSVYDSVRTRIISLIRLAIGYVNDDSELCHKWHVYVTGHSLGGALATLLALELSSNQLAKLHTLWGFK